MLGALWDAETAPGLRTLEAVEVLRQVWVQQFWVEDGTVRWRTEDDLPPASQRIRSPYDPQVRVSSKRSQVWTGYKVQVTESCDEDLPHLVTAVQTTAATLPDVVALPLVRADLAAKDLLPAEQFVDAAYVSAEQLVRSNAQGIDLVGPASQAPTRAKEGYTQEHFTLDWSTRTATCPQGAHAAAWKTNYDRHGARVVRVEFAGTDCRACPVRSACIDGTRYARTLCVRPEAEFRALHAARVRQQTEEFQQRYRRRAGIEGTISQAVRAYDLRHARYFGLAKTQVQHVLIAVALNLARLAAWFDGRTRAHTRVSPFASLFQPAA